MPKYIRPVSGLKLGGGQLVAPLVSGDTNVPATTNFSTQVPSFADRAQLSSLLQQENVTTDAHPPDIAKPDLVELLNLRAKMEMQDRDVVNLTANSGTYNTKADKIILRDQVIVTSQQGYKMLLREAAVEMKKGNVVSELPVEITLPNGLLKANRMEVVDSGDLIRFERGVVLDLDGAKQEASQ